LSSVRHSFWSNVAAVAYKEATIMRHDRALIAVIFLQPLMMILLFGLALSNKPRNVPWVVLDESRTATSRRLVEEIYLTGYFLPHQPVASYDEGRGRLARGAALAFLVIPQQFDRELQRGRPRVQLLVDGSDPLSAARVSGSIAQVAAELELRPEAQSHWPGASLREKSGIRTTGIDIRQRFWFNHTLLDRNFFLTALAGMLLTNMCLSVTSLGLVAERETGTYEQMLSLPTTPLEIVLGKLVPYVALSYLVLAFTTLAAGVFFGVWPRGSYLALVVVTLPFVLASLGIGVFVSTLARTSAQAVFITVFFILPSFVLSGVLFPYQLMPPGVREIGGLFPLRWYQIALRRIVARGGGLGDVAFPAMALVGLFALMLTLIRWRMRPRLG
jgi:ABC-2 type transport system permease protein